MSGKKAAQKLAEIDEQRMELEAQSAEAQRLLMKEEEFEALGEKQMSLNTQALNLKARLDRGDCLEAEREYFKREIEILENEVLDIEQRREQLQKEITGLSYIVEHGKNFDKHRVFSNIRKLMQLKDVKLGQIEKEAGTQPGYMSRLEKEGNTSDPTIEFVVSAAKTLNVSLDTLIYGVFGDITPTEAYLLKFLDSLIEDTRDDSLTWYRENKATLDKVDGRDYQTGEATHPLYRYNVEFDMSGNWSSETIYYNTKFFPNEGVYASGNCYNAALDPYGTHLYLMKCAMPGSDDFYELYILKDGQKPVCCSLESCDEISTTMDSLYKEIELSIKRVHLDIGTKSVIDTYFEDKNPPPF